MNNVEDFAHEFHRRAAAGERPAVWVDKQHLTSFLGMLAREGVSFARYCLDQISDPEVRRIIETIFFATAGGAAIGGVVGAFVAGPAGAQVGALVGSGVGLVASAIALTITAEHRGNRVRIALA